MASAATAGDPGPAALAKFDDQANAFVAKMTLAEKIGQMTQAEIGALGTYDTIAELKLGSIFSGGNSDPKAGNSLEAWTDAYDACQQAALKTRLKIPLVYGIDAVHGHSNVLGAVIFPHNIALGCTRDPKLVEEIARITALEVRATGINWTFAPCVTTPRDDRWGRTYEGFSEDAQLTAELGAAAVRGFQGDRLSDPTRILACAKHFIGDGGTVAEMRVSGSPGFDREHPLRLDQGDVRCDEATLRRLFLPPYKAAVQAGVGTIMPSYSSFNGVKCSANKHLLTDVLKGDLGFAGFLISDYNAVDQIDPDYKTAIKTSINAGMDMVMISNEYRKFITLLTELVEEGSVPMTRIDDAVRRILRVKAAMGLLDPQRSPLADRTLHADFGSDERRQVARAAVRQSVVLLKNKGGELPLSKKSGHIHVAGRAADDIGIQCGGWTIEWQGKPGPVTTHGTTILAALRGAAGPATKVTYDAAGKGGAGADVGVVVVGERPYAEGLGDSKDLGLPAEDLEALRAMKQSGLPVVVVLLCGRPVVVDKVLDAADAVLVAWLPGTEGAGVADVLFGDYKPTGKLSFTWPRRADQHPINVGDADYDPLFAFGYGLTY